MNTDSHHQSNNGQMHIGMHYHHRRHDDRSCMNKCTPCACGAEEDRIYRHHRHHRKSCQFHHEGWKGESDQGSDCIGSDSSSDSDIEEIRENFRMKPLHYGHGCSECYQRQQNAHGCRCTCRERSPDSGSSVDICLSQHEGDIPTVDGAEEGNNPASIRERRNPRGKSRVGEWEETRQHKRGEKIRRGSGVGATPQAGGEGNHSSCSLSSGRHTPDLESEEGEIQPQPGGPYFRPESRTTIDQETPFVSSYVHHHDPDHHVVHKPSKTHRSRAHSPGRHHYSHSPLLHFERVNGRLYAVEDRRGISLVR
jgi:hypothetical protein